MSIAFDARHCWAELQDLAHRPLCERVPAAIAKLTDPARYEAELSALPTDRSLAIARVEFWTAPTGGETGWALQVDGDRTWRFDEGDVLLLTLPLGDEDCSIRTPELRIVED